MVVGFFPALAAWGLLVLEGALRAAGTNVEAVGLKALSMQIPIAGLISLERGFIFTSMILAAMTVCLIEKHYRAAAAWAAVAAAISATGLMHGYTITNGAIINARPAPRASCGSTSTAQPERGSSRPNHTSEIPTIAAPTPVSSAGL